MLTLEKQAGRLYSPDLPSLTHNHDSIEQEHQLA